MAVLVLALSLCISLVSAVPHPDYGNFSVAEPGFVVDGRSVGVSDTAVYGTGYYAVDGDADWTSFELSGSPLPGKPGWLSGDVSATIPSLSGEYYVIVYSCSWGDGWGCHGGRWQLIVRGDVLGSAVASFTFDDARSFRIISLFIYTVHVIEGYLYFQRSKRD